MLAPAYVDQVRPVAERKTKPAAAQTPTVPCRPRVRRRPRGAAYLALGAAAGEPQHEAAARDHPQPAGGEFAVEAAGLAELEVAVELVDPGPQRQRAGRAVLLQGAAHLSGVRVDEHRERVGLVDALDARQHHPGRRVVLRARGVRPRPCPRGGPRGRRPPARRSAASRRRPSRRSSRRRRRSSRPGTRRRTARRSGRRPAGTGRRARPRRSAAAGRAGGARPSPSWCRRRLATGFWGSSVVVEGAMVIGGLLRDAGTSWRSSSRGVGASSSRHFV